MFDKKELIEGAASAISGFLGLTSFSFFWLPPSIKELGIFARGFVFCLLGFVVPYVFTKFALRKLGVEQPTVEDIMVGSFVIGSFSMYVFHLISNWTRRNEQKTILQVAKDLKRGEES